ncbi:hypothetical protein F8M41_010808 [Gigaspora margarita]|uniref:Uncharacterized protein n=1 Tax=Gigaspora margarita TaxID=4874 RepID=A0A8H4A255_GIGMA|nr:hypothetical protein F8M41_010808 [Gigaspora margarita]
MIRNPYVLVQPEKCETTDEEVSLDAETPRKDNDQLTRSTQDLKGGPQKLNVTNSPRTEEKVCTFRPKNKKRPWLEMFLGRMTIIKTIVPKTVLRLPIRQLRT